MKRSEMHVWWLKTILRGVHAKNKIRHLSWRTYKSMFFRSDIWYTAFLSIFTAGYSRGPLRYEQDIFKDWKNYPDGNKFQGTSCYYKSLEIQGNVMLMTHYCDVIFITHSNESILFWIDEELFPFHGFIFFHLGNI